MSFFLSSKKLIIGGGQKNRTGRKGGVAMLKRQEKRRGLKYLSETCHQLVLRPVRLEIDQLISRSGLKPASFSISKKASSVSSTISTIGSNPCLNFFVFPASLSAGRRHEGHHRSSTIHSHINPDQIESLDVEIRISGPTQNVLIISSDPSCIREKKKLYLITAP